METRDDSFLRRRRGLYVKVGDVFLTDRKLGVIRAGRVPYILHDRAGRGIKLRNFIKKEDPSGFQPSLRLATYDSLVVFFLAPMTTSLRPVKRNVHSKRCRLMAGELIKNMRNFQER